MVNRDELRRKAIAAFGALVMTTMSIVAAVNPALQAYASEKVPLHG